MSNKHRKYGKDKERRRQCTEAKGGSPSEEVNFVSSRHKSDDMGESYENLWMKYEFGMKLENDGRFDRQVSFISSGAIALSVTLVSTSNSVSISAALIAAWSLLLLCLVANLVSLKTAARGVDDEFKYIDDTKHVNKYSRATKILNVVSVLALIAGLAVMLAALAA